MDGRKRADIRPGVRVRVEQKPDQRTGKLTEGTVQEILTRSATHPHGIKVRLSSGVVGRVKEILQENAEGGIPPAPLQRKGPIRKAEEV